jgi:VanZ family protein
MGSSPSPLVIMRLLLLALLGVCALFMLGPFQALEQALIPWDKAAHFICFYMMTALLYVSFPHRRRPELTLLAVLIGAALELTQLFIGRDAELGDIAADAFGAYAVLVPMYIDRLRSPLRVDRRSRRVLRMVSTRVPLERRRAA